LDIVTISRLPQLPQNTLDFDIADARAASGRWASMSAALS
jgi:hypothetical protein